MTVGLLLILSVMGVVIFFLLIWLVREMENREFAEHNDIMKTVDDGRPVREMQEQRDMVAEERSPGSNDGLYKWRSGYARQTRNNRDPHDQ